ncbi:hypothetical protein ACFQZQ_03950 [Lysobacter koreensis]|uniref:Uncharacterized protein n=1 Tax=Lysobacter koreensis TaxID=266122 RepID=A0ABW2YLT1_9GAMM
MSNAIQFLESMGRNPSATHMSAFEYATTVAALDIEGAQKDALLERDESVLSNLLGGRDDMRCMIMAAE